MKEEINLSNFEEKLKLDRKLYLSNKDCNDLKTDLMAIQEISECIRYIADEQVKKHGVAVSDEAYAKRGYAEYFTSCKTIAYLSDYSIQLMYALLGKLTVLQ